VSGRVFESGGTGYTGAESWQHGASAPVTLDPAILRAPIVDIVSRSRKNAGIELETWLDP
jgi:hypothetical protein